MRFAVLALAATLALPAAAQPLRVGIISDPNMLDPAQSGAFVDRLVFAAICDKLVDIAPDLSFRAELATAWAWEDQGRALRLTLRQGVTFHDGTPMDAAAVAANLERYRNARESRRRTELKSVSAVEVVDARTVLIRLSEPFAPLLSVLADRAGMIMSPAALAQSGERIRDNPVCSGPFRFTRRVAQDRIETERFAAHWNAANIHLAGVTFLPIPDSTVRMVNLRAGQLDLITNVAPSDLADAARDARVKVVEGDSIAYQTMQINTGNGPRANNPLGRDPRVREALELAIDRRIINQVALEGRFIANNQTEAPGTPFHFADLPMPARDPVRARALLRAAGHQRVAFTLTVINSPVEQQVAEMIQAMGAEAGFDIKLEVLQAAAAVAKAESGDFEATTGIWSGRPDPDGNIAIWFACDGFLNRGKWCDPETDKALALGRSLTDPAARRPHYRLAVGRILADRPHVILYHYRWFWAMGAGVTGFQPTPDGIVRWAGMRRP